MKEKTFISVDLDKEVGAGLDLDTLYEEYAMYTKIETEAKKQKALIKEKLDKLFEESGTKDNAGNYWLVTSLGRFKKEARQKVELNPTFADAVLKRLHIYDDCVHFEPVYDLNMIKNYIADGSITSEEVGKLFKTEESYAIKQEKTGKKA